MKRRLLMADERSGNTASRAKGAEIAGWNVHWVEPYWADGLRRVSVALQYRAKQGPDIIGWNRSIVASATSYQPDVIWVESPQFIFPSTLKTLKHRTDAALVCAYSDDPRSPATKSRNFDRGKSLVRGRDKQNEELFSVCFFFAVLRSQV